MSFFWKKRSENNETKNKNKKKQDKLPDPLDLEDECIIKILALGDPAVGKTSLLYRFAEGDFHTHLQTRNGIDYREKRLVYSGRGVQKRLHMQLWDTANLDFFRSLTTKFCEDVCGFLLVFDLTNEQSYFDLKNWEDYIHKISLHRKIDVIICANKSDLTSLRIVNTYQVKELAAENDWGFFETSAATGLNVDCAFKLLVDRIMVTTNFGEKLVKVKQSRPKTGRLSFLRRYLLPRWFFGGNRSNSNDEIESGTSGFFAGTSNLYAADSNLYGCSSNFYANNARTHAKVTSGPFGSCSDHCGKTNMVRFAIESSDEDEDEQKDQRQHQFQIHFENPAENDNESPKQCVC